MIAENMDKFDALREYRLNIQHQYSEGLAFLLVDMVIYQMQMEASLATLGLLCKSLDKNKTQNN